LHQYRKTFKEEDKIHSFAIGLDANADVIAAKAADFIGTEHHEVFFTVEQGIALLDKLIWHLDIISVRAKCQCILENHGIRN
jgi:asparagine synthase (glutamine-hydrolysing)